MAQSYYDKLGVSKNASKDEIKKAYHKLALRYHPDKTGGDDKRFKEINEAYQILSDEKKRSEYDTYGRVFGEGQSASGQGFSQGFDFSGFDFSGGGEQSAWDLGDIFENFFSGRGQAGGGGARRRVKRGRDIFIDLEVSFEESVFGVERKVLISKTSACEKCDGKGAEPGTELKKCDICDGSGRVHETRKSFLGSFTTLKECSRCLGRGTIPSKKCSLCRGEGVRVKSEEILVRVPSGIESGEMIKIVGMGEAMANGVPGDLYCKVHVSRHPTLRRDGPHLNMDLDIKISDAILGIEREVKTLDGLIKIKIPAGVDYGEILRVRGKGVPNQRGGRGDLLIKILVRTPKRLSSKERKLVEDLRQEGF